MKQSVTILNSIAVKVKKIYGGLQLINSTAAAYVSVFDHNLFYCITKLSN